MKTHAGRPDNSDTISRYLESFDWKANASLLSATVICVGASMMLVLTPLLVDGLRHGTGAVTERGVAMIGSADQTGMFLGACLALLLLPGTSRRRFAIAGLALLVTGNLASLCIDRAGLSLYLFRLVGGTGGGMAMAAGYSAFGDAQRPERCFALFGLVQTGVGSALILALAPLAPRFGFAVWYSGSLLLALVALLASPYLNARACRRRPIPERVQSSIRTPWARAVLVAVTFFALSLSGSALWSNAESIGRSFGISAADTAAALAYSLIGSVAGSLLVLFSPRRWGRGVPTAGIGAVYVGGIALLLVPQTDQGFLCAAACFQFGTNLGFYAVGAISGADSSGRLAVIYLLAMKAGFAAGPLYAAVFVRGANFHDVVVGVLACATLFCGLLSATLITFSPKPAAAGAA